MSAQPSNTPDRGDATGEFLPEKPPEETLPVTGEFRPEPEGAINATVDFSNEPAAAIGPETTGALTEALTGEYRPDEGRADPAPGATVDFGTAEPPGGATLDHAPNDGEPRGTVRARAGGDTREKGMRATADPLASGSLPSTLRRQPNRTHGDGGKAPAAPLQLARYDMKTLAGKGGMGEVWLADDSAIGRPVAIKRMIRARPEQRDRFLVEARITGQLEHPGVVPVHEVGDDETGQPYYVMKFVQGDTLQKVIAAYHDPAADPGAKDVQRLRLLNIFLTLCQTVAYAHSRGIIHRDLKPENVMIGAYGETLLLDWGLAKVIGSAEDPSGMSARSWSEESNATMMGSAKGTPTYFSPEAAAGRVDEVDQRSDIYLLGATLYHILTGKPPRHATKIRELIEMAKNTPPPPPRSLKPDVPKPLDALCMKAMAHKREDRYESATALAEDMQRYLAGEPITAYRETFLERTWRWAKRHRTALVRGAAALFVVGLGLFAYAQIRDIERQREEDRIEAAKEIDRQKKKADDEALARKAEEAKANRLALEEKTRKDIQALHSSAEEARFYAALADQISDEAPVVDVAQAIDKGKAALAVARPWGPKLDDLPLADKRPELGKELYDLLIELAQMSTRQKGPEPLRQALVFLDQASLLAPPTRSYHRLRAQCLKELKLEDHGEVDEKKAADDTVPTTALDHYLLAEQYRRDSVRPLKGNRPAEGKESRRFLQPGHEMLDKAVKEYHQALRVDPNHYWSHFQLGGCYTGLGRAAEAVEKLGACVALSAAAAAGQPGRRPSSAWAYGARAMALASLKRFSEAEEDIKQALAIDPDSGRALLYRGIVHWQQKKYPEAFADLTAVLDAPEGKRLMEAAFTRAQVHLEKHEYDEALADLDRLDAAKLKMRTAYLHRARLHLAQQKMKPCLDNLTLFLTSGEAADPKDGSLYVARAAELRKLAHEIPAKAVAAREATYLLILEQLDAALKLGVHTAALYGELGAMEELLAGMRPKEALRRIRAAIDAYGKGIEADAKDVRLRIKRGWAHVTLGQFDKARDDFAKAVLLDAGNAEAHTGLGYVQANLKEFREARREANQATLHGAGDYLVLHNTACIYAVLSEKEAAARKEFEDLTLDLIRRSIDLWIKGGRGEPNLLRIIDGEPAFGPNIRKHPEFDKIVQGAK